MDDRLLNNVAIKDTHPLHLGDDNLESLYGAKIFSTLDLKAGYWEIPMNEQHMAKTAFWTSSRNLMECKMMAFGVCNAQATFSRLMDLTQSGLSWEIYIAYLDEVFVFAKTWKEHLNRLKTEFDRIRQAVFKSNPDKM